MKQLLIFPILLAGALLAGCSEEGSGPKAEDNIRKDIPMSRTEEEIAEATNDFSARLMSQLAEDGAADINGVVADNFVVSPLSLSMALSMTANGAEGTTREEILDVLGFEAADIEAANSLNRKLMEMLPSLDATTKVSFANALWVDGAVASTLRPEFAEMLSEVYQAPSAAVDGLGAQEGMNKINKWSAEHTGDLIPQLLKQPLGPNTLMALTNALYFKGRWATKFDKAKTAPARFINLDGTSTDVDMMRKDGLSAQACEDEGYKAAAFSYGNKAFSLIVVLPEFGTNPAKAFAAIDPADLRALAKGEAFSTNLNVKLPRFTVENGTNMLPVLSAMGIKEAFAPGCDFSGMWAVSPGEFYINKVFQGAKIIVDEEGSEAAATSIASGALTSPAPVQSSDFVVDRPFAFAIAERSTGVILFSGAVTKL